MEYKKVLWENTQYSSDLDYFHKRNIINTNPCIYEYIKFRGDKKDFWVGIIHVDLVQVGRKQFLKRIPSPNLSYTKGKFYGTLSTFDREVAITLYRCLGIEWVARFIEENSLYDGFCGFFLKKNIMKALITGKITSLQSLIKFIMKNNYHINIYDWKLVYKYLKDSWSSNLGLNILAEFTTNLNESLHIIINEDKNYERQSLFIDTVKSAVNLDEMVNPFWSDKRLSNEHKRQTRTLMKELLDTKDISLIYDEDKIAKVNTPTIEVIDSERRDYEEGLDMSNCVYTNYWNAIKNKGYIAFHMTYPEVCTFGLYPNKKCLDQIFLANNNPVKHETRQLAENYIKENIENILNLIK